MTDVVVLLSISLVAAEGAAIALVVTFVAAGSAVVGFGVRVWRRAGLYETAHGIVNLTRSGLSWRRELWRNIKDFRDDGGKRVVVVRTNGSTWQLTGVAQGLVIRWNDGETRDIVGTLNSRLSEWKRTET